MKNERKQRTWGMRFLAVLLSLTMVMTMSGFQALAEETMTESYTEAAAAESEAAAKAAAESEAAAKAAAESEAAAKAAAESEAAAKAAESEAAAKAAAESEAAKAAAESEAAAKAAAESEAAAKAAAESEAAAKAAAESEAAAKAAAESEAAAKQSEAESQAQPEKDTEIEAATEYQTSGETDTEGQTEAGTETSTETQTEVSGEATTETDTEEVTEAVTETATETETEIETEEVVLETSVKQEVFRKTLEDNTVQPMVKYTVKVRNTSDKTEAENITVKVILSDFLSYTNETGTTLDLVYYSSLGDAVDADAFETDEISKSTRNAYDGNEVVIWKDQHIGAGAEKTYIFFADVKDGVCDTEALRNIWIVNKKEITDDSRIQWFHTELLEANTELLTEFVFENDTMTVTATLSDPDILPEGAELIVEKVILTSDIKEFVNDALGSNEVLKSYVAYDIRFEVNGQEAEPKGGTVELSFDYKVSQKLIRNMSEEAEKVIDTEYKVLHLDETKKGTVVEEVASAISSSGSSKVSEVSFVADSFSIYIFGETGTPSTRDTFVSNGGKYTLDYILNNFNIFIKNDVYNTNHIVGSVIVGGNFNINNALGNGDVQWSAYPYIGGKANGISNVNEPLLKKAYLGMANQNTENPFPSAFNTYVYFTDEYIDMEKAFSALSAQSSGLVGGQNVEKDSNNNYNVDLGSKVKIIISDDSSWKTIRFKGNGSATSADTTIVNIMNSGEVTLPASNTADFPHDENGLLNGTGIVWNFPNATKVIIPSYATPLVGHIVAPNADVVFENGQYSGCIVAKTLQSSAEGHMHPYKGDVILAPTSSAFRAKKTIDGQSIEKSRQTEEETFTFSMSQLQAPENAPAFTTKEQQNDGSDVDFGDIVYDETYPEGDYYYLISEKAGTSDKYEYDTTEYIIKVTLRIEEDAYQKDISYYRGSSVNEAVDENRLNGISDVVFNNTTVGIYTANGEISLKAFKTMETDDVQLGTFQFELKDQKTGEVLETVANDETGTIAFSKIVYTEQDAGKSFVYTVSEVVPNQADQYIYDKTVYTVRVTVGDHGDGTLEVTAQVDDEDYTDQSMKFVNGTTRVNISKIDAATEYLLADAVLRVVDEDGQTVDEWKTDGTVHEIVGKLAAGGTYQLIEVSAPEGYEIAEPITFTVKEDGTADPVVMKDAMKASEKASIQVTKKLTYNGELIHAVDQTFYVALFADAEGTKRISDVKPLVFKNASASTVEFIGLDVGRTYYIGETDAAGAVIYTGELADGTLYAANFAEGNSAVIEEEDATKTILFENEFFKIPEGFYKEGELTITKKLLGADGSPINSDEVFYAGIFADAAYTVLSDAVDANIVALELNGGSQASATVKIAIPAGGEQTVYVTEVDADGNPVAGSEDFGYAVTVSKTEVTLDEQNNSADVTITNQKEETETETVIETETEIETETVIETETEKVTEKPKTLSVKTGDDTPILLYAVGAGAALLVILLLLAFGRKKKKANR